MNNHFVCAVFAMQRMSDDKLIAWESIHGRRTLVSAQLVVIIHFKLFFSEGEIANLCLLPRGDFSQIIVHIPKLIMQRVC
jgi:hypothetical protein